MALRLHVVNTFLRGFLAVAAWPRPDARSKIPMTSTRHPPADSTEGAQAPHQAKWSQAHLSRICYRECFFGVRLETKVQIGCDHHLSVVEACFSHDFGESALQVPKFLKRL